MVKHLHVINNHSIIQFCFLTEYAEQYVTVYINKKFIIFVFSNTKKINNITCMNHV